MTFLSRTFQHSVSHSAASAIPDYIQPEGYGLINNEPQIGVPDAAPGFSPKI